MLTLLIVLTFIGIVLYLVTTKIPMEPTIKGIIIVVGVVFALLYVGGALGILNGLPQVCRLR